VKEDAFIPVPFALSLSKGARATSTVELMAARR
jgi:hypothetical protein